MLTQFFARPAGTLAYTDYGGDGDLVIILPGMGALRGEYRSLYPSRKPVNFEQYLAALQTNLAEPGRFAAAKALGDSSRRP